MFISQVFKIYLYIIMTDFKEQPVYIKFSPRPDKTAVET
jgi:hypothetical protein